MSDQDKYKERKEQLKRFWEFEDDAKQALGSSEKKIKDAEGLIIDQLDKLNGGEEIEASGEEKSLVKSSANILLGIAAEGQISDWFRDFVMVFTLFLDNWNQQLGHRPDLDNTIKAVRRLVLGKETMMDAVGLIRRFLDEYRDFKQKAPPALELSRHYLKKIQNDIGKRDSTKSCKD